MKISFQGRYQDVVKYIADMEQLDWKLIWDKVTLKTVEYPLIEVEIEVSTLSDVKQWVGL